MSGPIITTGSLIPGRWYKITAIAPSDPDPSLKVGDVVKLNVELSDLAKRHEVNAKVVWSADYDPITQTNQVGVQFVKTVEIYQNLLSRI